MTADPRPTGLARLIEQARAATTILRDAARQGRIVHHRERDGLVMSIHNALDKAEAALALLGSGVGTPETAELYAAMGVTNQADALQNIKGATERIRFTASFESLQLQLHRLAGVGLDAREPERDGLHFRKKPIVITAVQWTGMNADAVLAFTLGRASVRDESFQRLNSSERVLIIETLEGSMRAEPGDWIICGVKGEFYPCKPDIFEATYEPV